MSEVLTTTFNDTKCENPGISKSLAFYKWSSLVQEKCQLEIQTQNQNQVELSASTLSLLREANPGDLPQRMVQSGACASLVSKLDNLYRGCMHRNFR
jgi:hypothetical protein